MDLKTKKIIAKEGLILLGFISLALILSLIFEKPKIHFKLINPSWIDSVFDYFENKGLLGIAYSLLGYLLYLIARFVIWAIKTLRKKEK